MTNLAWGGYRNGEIPTAKLVPVGESPVLKVTQYLEAGAAKCYIALDAAFFKKFGKHLTVTEGYRDLSRQKQLYYAYQNDPAHNPLAAYFGTSNHGYARAADFGSNTQTADTPEATWLKANAHEYGFHPTGYGFVRVEPWHYDWLPGTATASLNVTPIKQEEKRNMAQIQYYERTGTPTTEWSIAGREIGHKVFTDPDQAEEARINGRQYSGQGTVPIFLNRDDYIAMQKYWDAEHEVWKKEQIALIREALGTLSVGTGPTAAQIAKAVNDDAAARLRA